MANETKNVNHSYMLRFKTQIQDAGENVVYYPFKDANLASFNDYYKVYLPRVSKRPSRTASRTELWFFETNVFVKTDQQDNLYRGDIMADLIVGAFEKFDLPLQDFETGGDPIIGYIRMSPVDVREISNPANSDLQQINCFWTGFLAI